MINLGPRLLCAASFIRCRTKIVDIGTDHAYLPAYLVSQGIAESVLACDIGIMPLKNAQNTVDTYGLNNSISLRVSDGLREVFPDEADEITICGMGGTLISEILSAAPWIKRYGMHLILQPMTHTEDVRKYLYENGFEIEDERFVVDNKKVYCVMSAVYTGKACASHVGFYHFGFLPPRDEINARYVAKQLHRIDVKIEARRSADFITDEMRQLLDIREYYEKECGI